MRALVLSAAVAASAVLVVLSSAQPVAANETGMASIHNWRKVGRKTCMIDHQHDGNGSGANRKLAELQAIRAWSGFTDLEYGPAWANFNHAIEKSMRCENITGGVQCALLATPCRPY